MFTVSLSKLRAAESDRKVSTLSGRLFFINTPESKISINVCDLSRATIEWEGLNSSRVAANLTLSESSSGLPVSSISKTGWVITV